MINNFKKNIINIFGNNAEHWLLKLPDLIAELENKYQLTDLVPLVNMSLNYVASGLKNKKPIILKLGLNEEALNKEADCLQAFAHHGAANVLASEPGMLLMERANPGTTLKQYFPDRDKKATSIFCQCLQQLHQAEIPKKNNFLHLKELLSILDNNLDIPLDNLSKARQLRDDLLSSTDKVVLLHGDLHHENILQHGEHWWVIDPKGFIGDPTFDLCAFIHNPIPELLEQANTVDIINDRIQACADFLGFCKQRIHDWLYIKSVLCWAWCLEDKMAFNYFRQWVGQMDSWGECHGR